MATANAAQGAKRTITAAIAQGRPSEALASATFRGRARLHITQARGGL